MLHIAYYILHVTYYILHIICYNIIYYMIYVTYIYTLYYVYIVYYMLYIIYYRFQHEKAKCCLGFNFDPAPTPDSKCPDLIPKSPGTQTRPWSGMGTSH